MLADLFGLLGFFFVLLRAAIHCFQTIAVGGVIFLLSVANDPALRRRSWRGPSKCLIRWTALGFAISQLLSTLLNTVVLTSSAQLGIFQILGANYVVAGLLGCFAGIALCFFAETVERNTWFVAIAAIAMIGASVMTSHSASRMHGRALLVGLTAVHFIAIAAWMGGLPYLRLAMKHIDDAAVVSRLGRNFSRLALASVSTLILAGVGLAIPYVGSFDALYGTAYGVMMATKVVFLACMLLLGGANYFLVRRMRIAAPFNPDAKLSLIRFAEAEIGIGLTIILTAASLTSQPPAADLSRDRVTVSEIAARYAPRPPRFASPDAAQLSEASSVIILRAKAEGRGAPPSFIPGDIGNSVSLPADIAWSEYNHSWAGIVVFAMGFLALISRSKNLPWARMWPLMFLGLALFLFLRADPENWPLGPSSFWKSFGVADVLQHRLAILLIVALAIFESRVQMKRVESRLATLVFPAMCAFGGAMLLTHSHGLTNVKEQLLIEISHTPLAVLGVIAGWSRWLEVRLPSSNQVRKGLGWIWPVCFISIGLILMDYHESDAIRPLFQVSQQDARPATGAASGAEQWGLTPVGQK